EVHARAFVQVVAIADALRRGRKARQVRDVGGHVGQVLGAGQVMPISEILHALVPALVVSKVRQLLEQDAAVLPGDGGYFSIFRAATVRPVAGRAGLIQLGTVFEIGFERCALGEFTVAGDSRLDGLRESGSPGYRKQDDRQDVQHTHASKLAAACARRIQRTTYGPGRLRSSPHVRSGLPDGAGLRLADNPCQTRNGGPGSTAMIASSTQIADGWQVTAIHAARSPR